MGATTISWTDHSINPIRARSNGSVGHYCEKLSAGCALCYASRLQQRFRMPSFPGHAKPGLDKVELFLDGSKLEEVLARKKPTKFFWADCTDLFGYWVPDDWLDRCFAVMAITPHHVHQVLTKRPNRMAEYLNAPGLVDRLKAAALVVAGPVLPGRRWDERWDVRNARCFETWPLPSVWLGTSCENQAAADERIPHLLRCPSAVRFLSCEPLLGPIDLTHMDVEKAGDKDWCWINSLTGRQTDMGRPCRDVPTVHWIIVGGESGTGARTCDPQDIYSIVNQCERTRIACFVKQLGSNPYDKFNDECPKILDAKGGDWVGYDDLRVRQFPR